MGPLKDIKILEFAGIGPGPFCGMLLADLGAEVIRIERTENKEEAILMTFIIDQKNPLQQILKIKKQLMKF